MSTEEKFNLHEYRIAMLEETSKEIRTDINEIKSILNKLDKNLSAMPHEFKCPIHDIKITEMDKRVSVMEIKTETINKKIISWTAIASVILFLISQIFLPYAINNFKITQNSNQSQHTHSSDSNNPNK